MSKYCVISEFFHQLDEMEKLVEQVDDPTLREQLSAVHAHMHRIVRIGELAAMQIERGVGSRCISIPRPALAREKDTYKLSLIES